MHYNTGADVDEEDSCPPDLEAVEVEQVQQQHQFEQPRAQEQPAPAALFDPGSDLIRNLAIAIRVRF